MGPWGPGVYGVEGQSLQCMGVEGKRLGCMDIEKQNLLQQPASFAGPGTEKMPVSSKVGKTVNVVGDVTLSREGV